MTNSKTKWSAIALLVASFAAPQVAAQDYPEKPITIIFPWASGDPTETVLRMLGKHAAERLGQPFVINQIQGAGGTRAAAEGAKAEADGYTLLSNWVAPQIAAKLFNPKLPYSNDSYVPVGGVMAIPFTITVAADHPSDDIAEFVSWAEENGRKLNYGVCAAQSVPRLVGEQFMRSAGIDYNPIPNNSGCMGDNMTGLLNGTLDVSVGVVAATTVLEGQVKHLGLISDAPHPMAPDLKTASEQGVNIGWGNAALGWGGLVAPAGTPTEHLEVLQEVVKEVVTSEEFLADLGNLSGMVSYVPPAEYEQLWAESVELLAPYVADITQKK
ncbi:tripartite tricarboxylate transporter substrate binding protein [Alphaproteobacteria bacterium KMM 3653]|uniref:Tripartite tricarboxylate transporter substrate binding protein n=1 Tax=Harenicola maris TaxID=2841044 RepID=A0AAP2CWN2_9RHOB|nr:tripartite tricarboxylate transporter substrate binding protein [Harenicola maris]